MNLLALKFCLTVLAKPPFQLRLELFPVAHILRRDSDIPATKATRAYFIQYGHKLRGRPTTTLPIILNRNLGLIDNFRLQSTDDLVKITELTRDREQWRKLFARIEKAAEALQTMNWDATRQ